MPAAFIGHGSPMNALELNRYTSAWRAFGQSVLESIGRPRAILVVSAHWYINATAVTAMAVPRTIHDFYGFPAELFDVQYPAPGLPELADEVADVVQPTWVGVDVDSWGIDHGTWSVLVHAFPDASVPVVQLAINAYKPLEYHLGLGAKLATLRERGVLILGSGNVVHNLAGMDPALGDKAFDWAQRFDDQARAQVLNNPGDSVRLREHADYAAAVPTPDHFLPLLYFAGLAAHNGGGVEVLTDGCAHGSLSMTSYALGLDKAPTSSDVRGAAAPAGGVPADESNI
ncbi:4,5-DOPA dioxygenase extradiol [Mycolicibacterium sp. P1-5]|uniref:4,5-DOPA-extradiol-dioxygenase n=1 Tax=Mycolicibacterium sp. P1-5 TaxID=2024617 RepID=UPI0011EDADC3|nr:4,5-DOPA dioxygenase extradiol [Mycolicibacterium sp. P1-5]KAA0103495.1 4,5-DOPA dioxygenase extradiol [Mycolicibacterium sp. P1-5]